MPLVLIPARMRATRLPGKPLAEIAGLPMIVQVVRRAEDAGIGDVVVATDTPEIAEAVRAHGGRAVMTRADHPSGSDRVHEALGLIDPDGRVEQDPTLLRPGDLPELVADPEPAAAALGWRARVDLASLVARMVEVDLQRLRSGVADDAAYLDVP